MSSSFVIINYVYYLLSRVYQYLSYSHFYLFIFAGPKGPKLGPYCLLSTQLQPAQAQQAYTVSSPTSSCWPNACFPSFPQSLHAFLLSTRGLFAHLHEVLRLVSFCQPSSLQDSRHARPWFSAKHAASWRKLTSRPFLHLAERPFSPVVTYAWQKPAHPRASPKASSYFPSRAACRCFLLFMSSPAVVGPALQPQSPYWPPSTSRRRLSCNRPSTATTPTLVALS